MLIAILGDIHGGVEALRKALHSISTKYHIDAILCIGDFVSLGYRDIYKDLDQLFNIFQLLDSLGIPVFYTWGNRDIMLFDYIVKSCNRDIRKRAIEILDHLLELKNLKEVPSNGYLSLGNIRITSNPRLVESNTIFLVHYVDYVMHNALLHIEGHVHYGQVNENYINAGFIYRDDLHNAKPMEGMYFIVEIDDIKLKIVDVHYEFLSSELRTYRCPLHEEEGLFIIPKWWKRCPVCYDISRAKFSNPLQGLALLEQGGFS